MGLRRYTSINDNPTMDQVRAGTGHEVGEVHNTARDFSRT